MRCVDDAVVGPADMYFSPEFTSHDRGTLRCDAMRLHFDREAAQVNLKTHTARLLDETAIEETIAGSDFVINCTDEGNVSLVYKLNRVCLRNKIPWISATASGLEVFGRSHGIPRGDGLLSRVIGCAWWRARTTLKRVSDF